ncbi:MAG: type II toxin-antitoxin system PemK/MazF family toxin [Bacillota bacterium]
MNGKRSAGIVTEGEIWLADFPLEEDPDKYISRPVIVLHISGADVLSVKVTKHGPGRGDPFDTPLIHWREAGLNFSSTARISKTMFVDISQFSRRLGTVHPADLKVIQDVYMAYIEDKNAKYGLP